MVKENKKKIKKCKMTQMIARNQYSTVERQTFRRVLNKEGIDSDTHKYTVCESSKHKCNYF